MSILRGITVGCVVNAAWMTNVAMWDLVQVDGMVKFGVSWLSAGAVRGGSRLGRGGEEMLERLIDAWWWLRWKMGVPPAYQSVILPAGKPSPPCDTCGLHHGDGEMLVVVGFKDGMPDVRRTCGGRGHQ